MPSTLVQIPKRMRAFLLVCLIFFAEARALGDSFFSRSTHAYINPQGQIASIGQNGEYRVFTGSTFDLGFEHDIAESGFLINPFFRYGTMGLREREYVEYRTQTGGGIGVGFRVGRFKVLTGYYSQNHQATSASTDSGQPIQANSRELGYLGRLGYTIYDSAHLDLQLELGLQMGTITHESKEFGDEVENTRNLTAGLSAHVGQFCGGKVLAIGAAVVALAAICGRGGGCNFFNFGSGRSRSTDGVSTGVGRGC